MTRFKKKYLLLVSFFILSVFSILASTSKAYAAHPEQLRFAGNDRYQTAVQISQSNWDSSDSVVLATGENSPDALCAAPIAKQLNAPLLLTENNSLNNDTANEIARLGVKNIFIIGGTGVISADVEGSLEMQGIECLRLSGSDRYETSIAVDEYIADNFNISDEIFIVIGEDFSDALSISPIAAQKGSLIILASKDGLPNCCKNFISNKDFIKTYIVGGNDIISDDVVSQLPNFERIFGQDKYERNTAVLSKFEKDINFRKTYIATGEDYPDALAGAVVAANTSSPVILIGDIPNPVTKNFIDTKLSSITEIDVLGGYGVIRYPTMDYLTAQEIEDAEIKDMYFDSNVCLKLNGTESENYLKICPMALDSEPKTNYTASFTYSSSYLEIATVDEKGLIHGVSSGFTEISITAKNSNSQLTQYIRVFVIKDSDPVDTDKYPSIYSDVKKALTNFDDSIDFQEYYGSGDILETNFLIEKAFNDYINNDKSSYIYQTLLHDWRSQWNYNDNNSLKTVNITYPKTKEEINEYKNKIEDKTDEIILNLIKPGMSDSEKIKAIYNYLVSNTHYDGSEVIPPESRDPYGILINGTGVCQGYTNTMSLLLSKISIKTIPVYSPTMCHIWVIAYINSQWRHFDVTWDSGYGQGRYFNLTDEEMSRDHSWDRLRYPECK